jgi:hypothetical protein
MKSTSIVKLAFINLLVLIGMILSLLFLMSLAGDTVNFAKSFFPKKDKRADLPSYQDHDKARRIFADQKNSDTRYVPYAEWRQPAYASENLNIDEYGYRLHKIGVANNTDAQSLGFYGASTVWGTGVSDDDTLPAMFDSLTQTYNVKNYGERGYTSMQNLIDLITQLNTGKAPQNVIFYGGLNDIAVHCNLALTTRLNSHGTEGRIQSALDRTGTKHYLYNNIVVPIISLASSVLNKDKDAKIAGCSNDPSRANDVADMMVKNFEIMHTLVKSSGGKFHLFIQPSAYFGNPRIDYLDLDSNSFPFEKAEANAVLPLVVERLQQSQFKWFTDLRAVFDGDEILLLDHAHATPAGNALLARKIMMAFEQSFAE